MARDPSLYVVDGVRLPSVTEILGLSGFIDYGMVPKRVLQNAADRGHDVHEWVEGLDLGLLDPEQEPDERVAPYVRAWRQFRAENVVEVEGVEVVLLNRAHGYAGTVDLLCKLNGEPAICDYKTVVQLSPAVDLQLAGYALCLQEPRKRFSIQLGKDGRYRLHAHTSREDAHDFLAAVRSVKWRLRHGLVTLEDAA